MYTRIFAAALTAALPFSAHAATVSSAEVISVQRDPFSPSTTVTDDETVMDGNASATVGSFDRVEAVQNSDGTSEVSAETMREANTELNTAIATFTQTETNNFGMDRDYFLDYSLSGLSARLNHQSDEGLFSGGGLGGPVFDNPFLDDFTTLIDSNYTAASFEYIITVDGVEVFAARSDALARESGVTTENEVNFVSTLTDQGFGTTLFEIADIAGSIDLGTFAAGETLVVESTLIARSYATNIFDEITNGVGSRSTDPVNISSTGALTSAPTGVNPVPLPAAGWMLIAGVGGLMAAGRRRNRA